MKKILIVDDDTVTLGLLSRVLEPYSNEFDVLTAEDAMEAIKIISTKKIDLLVTDLRMPVMDGFELLAYLSKNHPEIPAIAMTAFGSPQIKSKITSGGRAKYFEKPLDTEALTEAICEELDAGAEGQILGISLPSFLQLVEMESKTCTLHVASDNDNGTMYFVKGELVAAETGNLKGDKAAYEIISWDKTSIEIKNFSKKKDKEIKQPLMNILMEGLRVKDEKDSKKAPKTPLKSPSEKTAPVINKSVHDEKKPEASSGPDTPKPSGAKPLKAKAEEAKPVDTQPSIKFSPEIEKFLNAIKKTTGVNEYRIYDSTDNLLDQNEGAKENSKLNPSEYLSVSEDLKELFNYGKLNFFVISTKIGIRHLFFGISDYKVAVSLRPGLAPKEFMKNMNLI